MMETTKNAALTDSAVTDENDSLTEVKHRTESVRSSKTRFGNGLWPLLLEIKNSERPSVVLMKTLANRPYMLELVDAQLDRTLLHHAAAQGKLEIVKYLFWKREANLNLVDKKGNTPLDCALDASAEAVVKYLRSKGAKTQAELLDPISLPASVELVSASTSIRQDAQSQVSDELKTALKKALTECALPRGDLINFVHKHPGFINEGLFELNKTMLHLAARAGKIEVVKWLIDKGAKVDVLDSHGSSPILIANSAGAVEVATYLKTVAVQTTLTVLVAGTGKGSVSKNPQLDSYRFGTRVGLVAAADAGSIFAGWRGAITSREPSISLLMDADKSLVAHFEKKSFSLMVTCNGVGKGRVSAAPEGQIHPMGASVILTATPETGSLFSAWSGDVNETATTCTVFMDGNKALTAKFTLQTFPLIKSVTGSGSGSISCDPEADSYEFGSKVKLTAKPAEGSIFNGWAGDAAGLDSRCIVDIDSAKHVVAEFQQLDIPDLDIGLTFDSVEPASMHSGDEAFIVYLSIANRGNKQIRVELPLASYVTQHGEEFEQDTWLSGLINGTQGATIRAGTFRKIGLVFFKEKLRQIVAGDQLYVSVSQTNPAQRFSFTFRCTDQASRDFTLIDAKLEGVPESVMELVATPPETTAVVAAASEMAELRQRIAFLETGLSEVQRELAALRAAPPMLTVASHPEPRPEVAPVPQPASQTLPQVLAWLVTQQRISVATLRSLLLPLDLLPSALIDEINERALDIVGEPALEDQDDEILVIQEVLAEILTDWDALNEFPEIAGEPPFKIPPLQ